MSPTIRKMILSSFAVSILLGMSNLSAAVAEHPDDIARRCRELFHNANGPRRVLKGDELRPLYLIFRAEEIQKKGRNVEDHIKELEYGKAHESWFGFDVEGFENIGFRYHTYDHETSAKSETVLFLDRAEFTDLERLYKVALSRNETLGAADLILQEIVRRALVPVGDDYLLLRALWIAHKDQPGLELPNILAIRTEREITALTAALIDGARKIYGAPRSAARRNEVNKDSVQANPRVPLLLGRITRYGYLNANQNILKPASSSAF